MRRILVPVIPILLIATGCSGGDDDVATTPTTPVTVSAEPDGQSAAPPTSGTPTTAPDPAADDPGTAATEAPVSGSGSSTSFCGFIADVDENPDVLGDSLDPEFLRTAMEASVAAIEEARDLAPPEIADDVELVLDAFLAIVELFAEYEWNLIAIGIDAADDPRLTSFDEEPFTGAIDRVGAFCGLDLNADDDPPAPEPDGPGGGPAEDIPSALLPPGVTETFDVGGGSFIVTSSDSFDDVVAFFTDVLGDPLFADDDQMTAVWITQFEGQMVSISMSGDGSSVEILIVITG